MKIACCVIIIVGTFFSLCQPLLAQEDTFGLMTADSNRLKEVVVSGVIPTNVKETSWNITGISQKEMRENGSFNVADALSRLPGISQINTGPGISKPVIRGLYGTRVLAVLSGLRFDNQQWQDEHGLGLNDIGIDRVEVIRGPAGLLYGSEAIGGVLSVIEELPAKPNTKLGDVNLRLFSNTYGAFTDVGMKGATTSFNWKVRAGINSQADYSDGNNNRVLNSRFGGFYLKAGVGFVKKRWQSINQYSGSLDQFGFITSDNLDAKTPDGRLSRSMDGPHHTVILHIISSQNSVVLKESRMKISIGAQSNLRMENEGGSRVSLKMLLSSLLYNVQWMKRISPVSELILGNNFLFQNNTNYGSRIIIPNANTVESGATVFVKNKWGKVILETGVGMSVRSIHTFLTGSFNTADRAIETFTRTYPVMNASAGAVVNLGDHWNMKLNAGTGFRSGNLAELSSDGLHEGTFRYEIGDPHLKVEKNVNTETEIAFTASRVNFSLAAFFNQFFRYIYLSPTGEKYLGFDVFRYRQDNAHLAGGEATFSFQIPFYVPLQLESYFSSVRGILHNGEYLPFIPSDKWHTGLRLMPKDGDVLKNIKLMASIDTYFPQDHPAQFETPTSGYILLNAGCSVSFVAKKRTVYADIAANNLMNTSYFDHLSRFKEYGIYNIGRNLVLNIRLPFLLK